MEAIIYATLGLIAIPVIRTAIKSYRAKKAWRWRPYDGINKHNHHAHVSFTIKGDEDSSWFNIPMIGGN